MPVIFDTLVLRRVFNSDVHYRQRVRTVSIHRDSGRSIMNPSSNIYVPQPVCPLPDDIFFQLSITSKLNCLPNAHRAVIVTIRRCCKNTKYKTKNISQTMNHITNIILYTLVSATPCPMLPHLFKWPNHEIENMANSYEHHDIMSCDVNVISPFCLSMFQLSDVAVVIRIHCFKLWSAITLIRCTQ